MKRIFSNVMAYLFGFFLCFFMFCFVIESVSFNYDYHIKNLDYNMIRRELSLEDDEIKNIAKDIANYIKGEKDSMQYKTTKGTELFNQRELTHMEDVRNLFKFCSFMKFASVSFCLVLGIWIYTLNGNYAFRIISRGTAIIMLWLGAFLALIAVWFTLDFNSFWTAFHKVAFTNDLWLMMPDDAIIIFYSSDFFTAVVKKIIMNFAYTFGTAFGVFVIGWMWLPRKRGRVFGKKNSRN